MSNLKLEGLKRPSTFRILGIIGAIVVLLFACVLLSRLTGAVVCPGVPIYAKPAEMPDKYLLVPTYSGNSLVYRPKNDGSIELGGGFVTEISVSSQNDVFAVATGNRVQVFSTSTNTLIWAASVNTQIQSIAFSPDGKLLAAGAADGSVEIWETITGGLFGSLTGNIDPITQISWSFNSSRLAATASNPRSFLVWHLQADNGLQVVHTTGSRRVGVLAWSPSDDEIVATAWENDITIWNIRKGMEQRSFRTQRIGNITSLFWLPNSSTIAIGGANLIELTDIETEVNLRSLEVDITQSITNITSSNNGKVIAISATATNFSQDGSVLNSNETYLWAANSSRQFSKHPSYRFHETGSAIALNSSGTSLYSSSDTEISVIDTQSGEIASSITGFSGLVTSLAFSPDNNLLAIGSSDGTISVWHLEQLQIVHLLKGHEGAVSGLSWSPSNLLLASVGLADNKLIVWNIESGQTLYEMNGSSGNIDKPSGMVSLAFSEDGRLISTTGFSRDTIWRASNGQQLCQIPTKDLLFAVRWLSAHQVDVPSLDTSTFDSSFAVSSDDKTRVAVALKDGRVLILAQLP